MKPYFTVRQSVLAGVEAFLRIAPHRSFVEQPQSEG